jgi:aspartate carbamoyltransferase regulatory subunit
MMAFPDSIEIAQFSNEIVIDATENFEKSIPSGATVEQLSTYAKTGIAMWDNSDEKGKTDMLKICGQEILKEKIPPPSLFPDPQTHLFM